MDVKVSSLNVTLPLTTQHLVHSVSVCLQLSLNLLNPDDLVRIAWEVSGSHKGVRSVLLAIIDKLIFQRLNIFLHLRKQQILIFLNSASNSVSLEKGIKDLENLKHLIGVSSRCKLVSEHSSDLGLYLIDFEFVGLLLVDVNLISFLGKVKDVDVVKERVSLLDFV